MRHIPKFSDPNLLVGPSTEDDAAVYQISDDLALIQTVDFFPPIVDDPYDFGEIAAANAFSDVYAMGGNPILALNILGFPAKLSKEDVLGKIIQGGVAKATEAGVLIVGGHTVDDNEPKYGMSVTGIIKPGFEITNSGAQPGDILVLTKPIGTGILTTASKFKKVNKKFLDQAVVTMKQLNDSASKAMSKVGVNACVDVTGFGLLGHLFKMLSASEVDAIVEFDKIPILEGVVEIADRNILPGGTKRNFESIQPYVKWDTTLTDAKKFIMCDAQTSGGLLISVPKDKLDEILIELKELGVETKAIVGEITVRKSPEHPEIQIIKSASN